MKPSRVLLSLYVGCLLSGVLLLFFGASGLRSYRSLSAYRDILQRNIGGLEEVHRELAEEEEALRTDPRRIALQARELGWFAADERLVRMEGRVRQQGPHPVGSLVRPARAKPHDATLLRVLAVCLPIGIYAALWYRQRRRWGRRWQPAGRR